MSSSRLRFGSALAFLFTLLPSAPVAAQVVNVLHTFTDGPNDGKNPVGALVQSGSSFYGMTNEGGANGNGSVFSTGTDGSAFTLLHSFANSPTNGNGPFGTLALSGSTLYGMTQFGGSVTPNDGTIFKMNTDGTGFSLVHVFLGGTTDGSNPLGSPVLSGSVMYGMTFQGGASNLGTIFKVNVDGRGFAPIHSFAGGPGDGRSPSNNSLVVSGSTLYGMTSGGGSADEGIVFKVNADGTGFTVLHTFNPATGDGWDPHGSLTLSGATLYGMTRQGGGAAGTVFQINTDGTGYNLLHTFAGSPGDGANPLGNLLGSGPLFYGTTPIGGADALGSLFDINADGTGYNELYSFSGGPNDGNGPTDLTQFGGLLYGTTVQGGSSNDGVIYSFPVPEPSSLVLVGAAAGVATWAAPRRRLGAK